MVLYGWMYDGVAVVRRSCRGKVSHSFMGRGVLGVVLSFLQGVEWGCGLSTTMLG